MAPVSVRRPLTGRLSPKHSSFRIPSAVSFRFLSFLFLSSGSCPPFLRVPSGRAAAVCRVTLQFSIILGIIYPYVGIIRVSDGSRGRGVAVAERESSPRERSRMTGKWRRHLYRADSSLRSSNTRTVTASPTDLSLSPLSVSVILQLARAAPSFRFLLPPLSSPPF